MCTGMEPSNRPLAGVSRSTERLQCAVRASPGILHFTMLKARSLRPPPACRPIAVNLAAAGPRAQHSRARQGHACMAPHLVSRESCSAASSASEPEPRLLRWWPTLVCRKSGTACCRWLSFLGCRVRARECMYVREREREREREEKKTGKERASADTLSWSGRRMWCGCKHRRPVPAASTTSAQPPTSCFHDKRTATGTPHSQSARSHRHTAHGSQAGHVVASAATGTGPVWRERARMDGVHASAWAHHHRLPDGVTHTPSSASPRPPTFSPAHTCTPRPFGGHGWMPRTTTPRGQACRGTHRGARRRPAPASLSPPVEMRLPLPP